MGIQGAARTFMASALVVAAVAGCGPASSAPAANSSAAPSAIAAQSPPASVAITPSPRALELLGVIPDGTLDSSTATRLQGVLDSIASGGEPDAIGAVITAAGSWAGAAGVDGAKGRKATAADMFNIASVSKPILSALVLQLAEEGAVDLDAPLATYLGDLGPKANGATVRQALAMRSGIGDTPSNMIDEARADCSRVWSRADTVASIPKAEASPGTSFQYSNPTYKLLGYAVEQVTGKPLEASFDERLFSPFGLDRILLQGASRATPKPWALPIDAYRGALDLSAYGVGGALPCISVATFSFATSAVASDAETLARWGWALFGGTMLKRESLAAMTNAEYGSYRLGIERLPDFGTTDSFGTHGGQVGYAAFLMIVPDRQTVAVLFVNDEQAEVEDGARRLIVATEP